MSLVKSQPDLAEFFIWPNPALRAYFARTNRGNSEDYRPPFFEGQDRQEVAHRWQKIVDRLGVKSTWPTLYAYELEMKGKMGPMSIQLPLLERLDTIEEYFTEVEIPSTPLKQAAIHEAQRFFRRMSGIRMRSRRNTLDKMRKNTNSGNPWFTRRNRILNQALASRCVKQGQDWYFDTPDGRFKVTAIVGWRGQEGGLSPEDVKQRVIWMMSILLNIEELQFYQPAVEAAQKTKLIPAYVSMDYVDEVVTKLFDTKGSKDLVICTDFKKFDQHFNEHMQGAAKEIEAYLFNSSEDWMERIYPAKFNIPLICNEDIMYVGPHGMGSGSGGTNFDECMAHKALQFEAALENHSRLNPYSMAYGDDGILTYPGITVEQVCSVYEQHGQIMNRDKQYASYDDCVVLRRWHHVAYRKDGIMVGVYSTFRALGRLLAQERYYDPEFWSAEMVTLRALSILENCKHHPLFHEFIDFVMKGDKLRLGLAVPGFFDKLEGIARKAMDVFTDFLGYTKTIQNSDPSGINDWEVVKYLKSLA